MKKIDDYLEFLLQEKGEDILSNGENKKAIISDEDNDKYVRTDF